jgi:hypothetical protein
MSGAGMSESAEVNGGIGWSRLRFGALIQVEIFRSAHIPATVVVAPSSGAAMAVTTGNGAPVASGV